MENCISQKDPDPYRQRRTTLFTREEGGITYRIPALIYIPDDRTFLAFAEKRTSPKDSDAKVLVMRQGTPKGGSIEWSTAEEVKNAHKDGYRSMNPCPVYERESRTLFLFFICVKDGIKEMDQIRLKARNTTRLCYITRKNNRSWSSLTDLTESMIRDDMWATFAVGPGHGIQMKSGRLIIPAYAYYIESDSSSSSKPYALTFYSDDKGENWQMGKKLDIESIECQMAEFPDQSGKSQLYCNARSAQGYRIQAVTNCASEYWKMHNSNELAETGGGCHGSVLSFPSIVQEGCGSSTSHAKTWLLYSHPSDNERRMHLGIYLKKSHFSSPGWEKLRILNDGPSGYSDLTQCEASDRFACLMECGEKEPDEKIQFVEFSLSDDRPISKQCCCFLFCLLCAKKCFGL